MQKRAMGIVCFLAVCCAVMVPALSAQTTPGKMSYTYVAQWAVPRAQWGDIVKLDEQDRSVLDKLVADGTLISYGAYTNLIHQEGEPTHGTWFSAPSEGNLLKALEMIYAQPGLVGAPVQGASRHWDLILKGDIRNAKPGTSTGGYLTWSQWQVKPGAMRSYTELTKQSLVPVLEKLLADGTVNSYGQLIEDYHQQKMGTVFEYFTTPDAASMDKVNKALDDTFESNPALQGAVQNLLEREGHRDFLTRLRFMVNK